MSPQSGRLSYDDIASSMNLNPPSKPKNSLRDKMMKGENFLKIQGGLRDHLARKITDSKSSNPTPKSHKSSVIVRAKNSLLKQQLPMSPPKEDFQIIDMTVENELERQDTKKSSLKNCSNRASYTNFINILTNESKSGGMPQAAYQGGNGKSY